MRKLKRFFSLLLFTVLSFLIVFEIGFRMMTQTNLDGQRFFLAWPLPPFHIPVRETEDVIARYLASDDSRLIYDPYTGWRYRPGIGDYNSAGMRADREYDLVAADDGMRVAVFGDSFTHGDEVPREASWAYALEQTLGEQGEVLNFGVGSYGIDQAYLAWKHRGRAYRPDVVILGFVEVAVVRSMSVYLKFQSNTLSLRIDNPFTKPRYALENDELILHNSPTVAPEEMGRFLTDFPNSPLAQYEYFYHPEDYQDHWWMHSYALTAFSELGSRLSIGSKNGFPIVQMNQSPRHFHETDFFGPQSEPHQLMLALLRQWHQEVKAEGGQFLIVHLPMKSTVQDYQRSQIVRYQHLLDAMKAEFTWVETIHAFDAPSVDSHFAEMGHYSPAGNLLIADILAAQLITDSE